MNLHTVHKIIRDTGSGTRLYLAAFVQTPQRQQATTTKLVRDNSVFRACLSGMALRSALKTSGHNPGALGRIVLRIWAAVKTTYTPAGDVFAPFQVRNCLFD